ASLAIRKLVGRETPVPWRRSRYRCRLRIILRGAFVVFVFLLVQSGERFVQVRPIGIILYPAFQEILAEGKIFSLRFDSQREARLVAIVHRGYARVPSNMPGRRVPQQKHRWWEVWDGQKQ